MSSLMKQAAIYAMQPTEDIKGMSRLKKTMKRMKEMIHPSFLWRLYPLEVSDEGLHLAGAGLSLEGNLAGKMLSDAKAVLVVAATLGMDFDRELKRLLITDVQEAWMWNACGSALLESFLDEKEKELQTQFSDLHFTDRFSCGYGDLSLSLQPKLISLLELNNRLGIWVDEGYLMHPEKSVTAFIGLCEKPQPHPITGCKGCIIQACPYVQKGGNCHEIIQ